MSKSSSYRILLNIPGLQIFSRITCDIAGIKENRFASVFGGRLQASPYPYPPTLPPPPPLPPGKKKARGYPRGE